MRWLTYRSRYSTTQGGLPDCCTRLQKLRDTVRGHSTRPELAELRSSLDPLMKRLNDKAAIDLKRPTHSTGGSPRHSSGSSSHISSTTPTPSRLKLDLPKFSGELLDWREFWSIFFARLEREVSLTDVEKITCLEDAMTDQTAKDLVRLNGYGGSYENVVQALQARYNRHKLVYKHHVKQVLSLSPITDDYHSYTNFKNIVTKHRNGLQASGGDSFEQLLTSLFEGLLPRNASAMWSEFTAKDFRPPTIKTFMDFIDRRIENTETLSNTTKRSTPTPDRHYSPTSSNHSSGKLKPREKNHPRAFHMKEVRTEVCPACDGAHSIYQCTTFGAWTVDRRHSLVRRKHLCFNCLGSNHSIETCTSRRTCRECSQKHHTLLHRPAANSRPAESTDAQQSAFNGMLTPSHSPEPAELSVSDPVAPLPAAGEESSWTSLHVQTETGEPDLSPAQFPVTALATVSAGPLSRRARILMDSGSAITLVTARLANSINTPKIKSRMVIRGMQNSTVACSSHAVKLTLKPLSDDPHESVIVLTHVVDWITDIELQDLSSVRDQPFLRLADPELGRSGMVDVLLSVVDTNRCMHDISVSSPDRSTCAWQSIFG